MITAVLAMAGGPPSAETLAAFFRHPLIRKIVVLQEGQPQATAASYEILPGGPLAGETWNALVGRLKTPYCLFVPETVPLVLGQRALERMIAAAEATGAAIVYGDYADQGEGELRNHPLIDYQAGSLRDDFSFGPLVLLTTKALRRAVQRYGPLPQHRWAGWYDLRLRLSTDQLPFHLPEPLATVAAVPDGTKGTHFAYVDPRFRHLQEEMEAAVTAHLQRLGALLPAGHRELPAFPDTFAVEASVVIPVRNRVRTVCEAVASALGQETDFPFNVIVVDNHSTDGTTELLTELASRQRALVHLRPERTDLSIGGCWNEAIYSPACGRYAIQLDSDDLYSGKETLSRLVDLLKRERCAMAIGAYRIVDAGLKEIPPGLIDHREWTEANGRNNALRINGLGAPRAFVTALLRRIGFPNVGYGEDYAVALRLCREYRIGRIFDCLYLCRRWEGNSDASLTVTQANHYNLYKDRLRTMEIEDRRKLNGVRRWRS
ncbi:MAG: glycosyltransferase [Syntrophaceae bacterium]|nr:glycosyltransferase [Syntrophaceae bacterium]